MRHLPIESAPDRVDALLNEAEAILSDERAVSLEAIRYVKLDSRLGWEPRMEYRCAPEHLEWKLRQLDYVINTEFKAYRNSMRFDINDTNVVADYFAI